MKDERERAEVRESLGSAVLGVGIATFFLNLMISGGSIGWAVTLALPMTLGASFGYVSSLGIWGRVFVAWFLVFAAAVGLGALGATGLFCGLALVLVASAPVIVGAFIGAGVRKWLESRVGKRPVGLGLLPLIFIPPSVASIEPKAPYDLHTVQTTEIIRVPAAELWERIMFYEDVDSEPPLLLQVGLPKPIRTVGRPKVEGDITVCVYDKGYLKKRTTKVEDERFLGFDVIEQQGIEDKSIRLKDGSFLFEEIRAGVKVTLTTTYEPLLSPRWVWRPLEDWSAHTLHEHVLEGMRVGNRKAPFAPLRPIDEEKLWLVGSVR